MSVVPIRQKQTKPDKTKLVAANQKAVDALAANSGDWRVEGIPGLYVRCGASSKSFFQQRRIDGHLVREYFGAVTVKKVKELAMRRWGAIRPPAQDEAVRLGAAIEAYIRHRLSMKKMAEATEKLARYNTDRYLVGWKDRTLDQMGRDRAGVAALHTRLTEKHGAATCNQVMRLLSAVYRWHRDRVYGDLPEWPRKVAEIHSIAARDWAYSPDELRAWWFHPSKKKDEKPGGVKTLGPIKRTWWLAALLTGARKGSVEALKWPDIDLDKKVIRFRVTKGDRPYSVPMSETLAALFTKYRESPDVPPSDWVFPSPVIDGAHLIDVKNPNEGVGPAHRLRHTFRTTLAELGAAPDQARMLMGHSMGGDVSRGYISTPLVVESLRPIVNAVAQHYTKIIPGIVE
jgi:integrase